MSRTYRLIALSAFIALALALVALAADPQTKTGVVKSVDVKAKTLVVKLTPRDLTFTVTDTTTFTLDGKPSTLEEAVKEGFKVSVTYTREGDTRMATKVETTTVQESK